MWITNNPIIDSLQSTGKSKLATATACSSLNVVMTTWHHLVDHQLPTFRAVRYGRDIDILKIVTELFN